MEFPENVGAQMAKLERALRGGDLVNKLDWYEWLPDDLTSRISCRKVIGPHKGWFGPECYCGREPAPGSALRGAHGG